MNEGDAKKWEQAKKEWDKHLELKTPEYKVDKVQKFIVSIMGEFHDRNSDLTRAFKAKAAAYKMSALSRLSAQHKLLQRQDDMSARPDECPDFEGESQADKDKRKKEIEASRPTLTNVDDQAKEDLLMEFLLDLQSRIQAVLIMVEACLLACLLCTLTKRTAAHGLDRL